jgi:hypothetical protein
MNENNTPNIQVSKAFAEAWKGFKGWWIPLCIISSILFFSQKWLPALVIQEFSEVRIVDSYKQEYQILSQKLDSGSNPAYAISHFMEQIAQLNNSPETQMLFKKILGFMGMLFLFVCVLHVIIILMSKFSVSTGKERIKDHIGKPFKLTPSYILLTIIKIIPFLFCFIPGFYFYVKLYFTGFIITEKSVNPFTAMVKSWKMTNGIFWPTFAIFMVTLVIDFLSLITIIGFIPGTPFKYTLRASLYKQALARMESLKV